MKNKLLCLSLPVFLISFLAVNAFANLVTNGDFQSGGTPFTTGLTPGSILSGAAYYSIISNPNSQHGSAASYFDHTYGNSSGLMMAVNGRDVGGPDLVWQQIVSVTPGTTYNFSAWISSWYPTAPAQLSFKINNIEQLVFAASSTTGLWQNAIFNWTAGAAVTGATLSIFNTNYAFTGNDFALDDISLKAVPIPAAAWLLGTGLIGLVALRRKFN